MASNNHLLKTSNESPEDKLHEYIDWTRTTWCTSNNHWDDIVHAFLGLGTEAGEVQSILQKGIYKTNGLLDKERLKDELGDVFYYWSTLCRLYNLNPYDLMEQNKRKLMARHNKGDSNG